METHYEARIYSTEKTNYFISVVKVSKYLSKTEIWNYKEEAKLNYNIRTNIPVILI